MENEAPEAMELTRSPKRVTFAPDPIISDDSLSLETPPILPDNNAPDLLPSSDPRLDSPEPPPQPQSEPAPVFGSAAPAVIRDVDMISEDEIHGEEENIRRQTEQHVRFLQRLFDSVSGLQTEIKVLENRLVDAEVQLQNVRDAKHVVEQDLQKQTEVSHVLEDEIDKLKEHLGELNKQLSLSQGDLREEIERQVHEIGTLKETVDKQADKLRSLRWLKTQVDAFHLAEKHLFEEPSHACMLPDNFIVVADTQKGLLLFNDDTELIKEVRSNAWKWPIGLAQDIEHGRLFVSLKRLEGTDAGAKTWIRSIGVFTLDLDFLEYIDGPNATGFLNSAKENLAYSPKSGEIFMGIMDPAGSGLWSKNLRKEDGEWCEVSRRSGVHFVDVQVFPSPTSNTELLVVESAKGYVHRLTVKGSEILNRTPHAPVTQPDAIGVDDEGNVFVHDCETGKVLQLDRMDFSIRREICLIDDGVYSITACRSYLGIAVRAGKQVYIYKYHTDAEYED